MSKVQTEKPRPVDVVLGDLSKELPKKRESKDWPTCASMYCV